MIVGLGYDASVNGGYVRLMSMSSDEYIHLSVAAFDYINDRTSEIFALAGQSILLASIMNQDDYCLYALFLQLPNNSIDRICLIQER